MSATFQYGKPTLSKRQSFFSLEERIIQNFINELRINPDEPNNDASDIVVEELLFGVSIITVMVSGKGKTKCWLSTCEAKVNELNPLGYVHGDIFFVLSKTKTGWILYQRCTDEKCLKEKLVLKELSGMGIEVILDKMLISEKANSDNLALTRQLSSEGKWKCVKCQSIHKIQNNINDRVCDKCNTDIKGLDVKSIQPTDVKGLDIKATQLTDTKATQPTDTKGLDIKATQTIVQTKCTICNKDNTKNEPCTQCLALLQTEWQCSKCTFINQPPQVVCPNDPNKGRKCAVCEN